VNRLTTSQKVIVIAGMHRSGTTFTARWLQSCGLFIGSNLLHSKYEHANPNGAHYEDIDFLSLHRRILKANGLNGDGYITQETFSISSAFRAEAEVLITSRQHHEWGWKEPRTCLFLDFWQQLLPDAYYLVVYRRPEGVADSLLRRKLNHPLMSRRLFYRLRYSDVDQHIAHYINVWTRYNRDILNAIDKHTKQTLVLRIGDVVPQSLNVVDHMNTQWGFHLAPNDAATIYDDEKMKKQTSYVKKEVLSVRSALDEAESVFQRLEQWREQSLSALKAQSRPYEQP
jgi:hypothetical protein